MARPEAVDGGVGGGRSRLCALLDGAGGGTAGEVDLDGVLAGPVFDVLKDIDVFKKVAVDPELETVVWPNGEELAPEFLKELHEKKMRAI